MRHGSPEGIDGLTREGARAGVGDRDGDHDRKPNAERFEDFVDRDQRRLRIQGVEDRLDEQDVDLAFDERLDLLPVGLRQLVEAKSPRSGIVHVR